VARVVGLAVEVEIVVAATLAAPKPASPKPAVVMIVAAATRSMFFHALLVPTRSQPNTHVPGAHFLADFCESACGGLFFSCG
jgi:hypothetical protein